MSSVYFSSCYLFGGGSQENRSVIELNWIRVGKNTALTESALYGQDHSGHGARIIWVDAHDNTGAMVMSNWGVKKLNDLPKVLWFLSCRVEIWTQTSLKRNTGKWKQFDLFCWQDYGYVLFALIFANGKIKPWSYFFFLFFFFQYIVISNLWTSCILKLSARGVWK